jgi:vacuolar protein sorting-associated protein IST1
MACGRIKIASNKKAALLKQSKRDVATMLMQDPPQEEKARIRAEALIRDVNLIEAYGILQLECELLHERIKLIGSSKTCPHDLVSVISTLIWASHRVDIEELILIQKQFTSKYGKSFEKNAMRNVDGVLNERVVSKLSVEPPAAYLVQTYLEQICESNNVEWTPSVKLTAESAVQPMVSGVLLS